MYINHFLFLFWPSFTSTTLPQYSSTFLFFLFGPHSYLHCINMSIKFNNDNTLFCEKKVKNITKLFFKAKKKREEEDDEGMNLTQLFD